MITKWRCEKCATHGSVRHKADAGVYDVRNQLDRAHAKKAPGCALYHGLSRVRVSESGPTKGSQT